MTRFTSVTPNLIVKDVARSTAFYRDVLEFQIKQTVPVLTRSMRRWPGGRPS